MEAEDITISLNYKVAGKKPLSKHSFSSPHISFWSCHNVIWTDRIKHTVFKKTEFMDFKIGIHCLKSRRLSRAKRWASPFWWTSTLTWPNSILWKATSTVWRPSSSFKEKFPWPTITDSSKRYQNELKRIVVMNTLFV